MVRVTYTNVQPPVMTIDDALEKGEIIPTPDIPDVVVGDAESKLDSRNFKLVAGKVSLSKFVENLEDIFSLNVAIFDFELI